MTLGLYISVPFCRTKCSYCNFASGVFSRARFQPYVDRICADMESAARTAEQLNARFDASVNSVYLGGGTPSLLDIEQLERLFVTISQNFQVLPESEITVECAPGTLKPEVIESLLRCGVNRVSLGVQSFVDEEARAIGRLHNRATVLDDISRLKAAGIQNINVDLIAGLPHQNMPSWETSLAEAISADVPHVSIYMLEVDDDSRLGREVIAGGTKYHAHFVPDDDLTAELYEVAHRKLEESGIKQYEISNFAKHGQQSLHNLKYWLRQPYLGFGVDAHSMLESAANLNMAKSAELQTDLQARSAVRFAAADSLDEYVSGSALKTTHVSSREAIQESFFLGLRLNRGVDLKKIAAQFGEDAVAVYSGTIQELTELELLHREESLIRLTPRGRLLSNEVFARFLEPDAAALEGRSP